MTSALIFDIETVGESFDELDATTQESLTRWIKKESQNEDEYRALLDDVKSGLGFSPLTGEIVAIGVLDSHKNKGAVYFQAPGKTYNPEEYAGCALKAMAEAEMLKEFWRIAESYGEFVTFNGRSFDVPFLMVRSAVRGISPTKDLMSNRYLDRQKKGAVHVDLLDVLTFQGAMRRKGNLHLWARAFGIKSPKGEGITGDDVGELFRGGKFLEIARYNAGDLKATKELYDKWNSHLKNI